MNQDGVSDAKTGELLGAHRSGAESHHRADPRLCDRPAKLENDRKKNLMKHGSFRNPTLSEMMHESGAGCLGRCDPHVSVFKGEVLGLSAAPPALQPFPPGYFGTRKKGTVLRKWAVAF